MPSTAYRLPAFVCCLLLLTASTGCLHRHHHHAARRYPPPPPPSQPPPPETGGAPAPSIPPTPSRSVPGAPPAPIVQGEEGIASWYGHPYHGRPTASGEIYNMYGISAAHRTLPFGTEVRVHDLDNGRSVDVRINDRGPFVEGRIIDLSYGAAKAIAMLGPGIARVQLEILNPQVASLPGIFAVQVGAFRDPSNAARMRDRITAAAFSQVMIQSFDRGDGMFHRVRVGREATEDDARALAEQLKQAGLATETFVVRLNY
ncbi:MAG TPA: septal ring lytic transglycosylase RlpA family protein [Terriglobia bacterium]|nr:septal ring lytic transglycosylase RlpA family protein [Terriglobia bacterium]